MTTLQDSASSNAAQANIEVNAANPSLPIAAAIWRRIILWRAHAAERQQLLAMDERMLRDIGITRYDARAEAARSYWRA
jgi:uncharacterized protein YjiS (DUF1127 family)